MHSPDALLLADFPVASLRSGRARPKAVLKLAADVQVLFDDWTDSYLADPDLAGKFAALSSGISFTYDFSSCSFPKFKTSAKRGFSREKNLFFWFLRPQNGGGGPSTQILSKNVKNPVIWPNLGYFCLLWAGPVEQCCTPVYLPIGDFQQNSNFRWILWPQNRDGGGPPTRAFSQTIKNPGIGPIFGVFLSALGWCSRTMLHTSVPV